MLGAWVRKEYFMLEDKPPGLLHRLGDNRKVVATYFGQVSFDLFSALIVDLLRLRLSLLLLISLLPSVSLGSRVSLLPVLA